MCAYFDPAWKYLCVSILAVQVFFFFLFCPLHKPTLVFSLLCYTYVCINMYNA